MTKALFTLVLFLVTSSLFAQDISNEERRLYQIIMEYRESRGLPVIPLSPSLTLVAQAHVNDLQSSSQSDQCNLHSWSDNGSWTSCCYTSDHSKASCMWDKPRELTSYKGNGYEIASWNSSTITAIDALERWKSSPGHHALIINDDIWSDPWQSIGVGISENYAVVWFGNEPDVEPLVILPEEGNAQVGFNHGFYMVGISPNLFVDDIKQTIAFYEQLNFEVLSMSPDYAEPHMAVLSCGNIRFIIQTLASLGEDMPSVRRQKGGSLILYINVVNIQWLYNRIKDKVNVIEELAQTDYDTNEFSIVDLNGYVLTFSEDIEE